MEKNKRSKLNWKSVSLLTAGWVLSCPLVAQAQLSLEAKYRLLGSEVQASFEPLRAVLQDSSAVMLDGWKSFGYGVVVSRDGFILTKASELEDREEFSVRVGKEQYKEVTVVGIDAQWDVALLKVDAEDLKPVVWNEGEEPGHGMFVVSNGATSRIKRRARLGIISANAREVGGGSAVVLGVQLKADGDGVVVESVSEESGAAKAGLKKGDELVKADGRDIASREELLKILEDKAPGDKLAVEFLRDGETQTAEVELSARYKAFPAKRTRNDGMSGRTSERRSNFKRVLQHDIGLSERSVGGPLLDLDGRCVGMNIAYANRAETFAIPAKELRDVYDKLRGGGE